MLLLQIAPFLKGCPDGAEVHKISENRALRLVMSLIVVIVEGSQIMDSQIVPLGVLFRHPFFLSVHYPEVQYCKPDCDSVIHRRAVDFFERWSTGNRIACKGVCF